MIFSSCKAAKRSAAELREYFGSAAAGKKGRNRAVRRKSDRLLDNSASRRYAENMDGAPNLNENHEIDYSDAHQVIKALIKRNIPEQAAEVLIAYGRFQAETGPAGDRQELRHQGGVPCGSVAPGAYRGVPKQPRHQARRGHGQAGAPEGYRGKQAEPSERNHRVIQEDHTLDGGHHAGAHRVNNRSNHRPDQVAFGGCVSNNELLLLGTSKKHPFRFWLDLYHS